MSLFESVRRSVAQEKSFVLATVIASPSGMGNKAILAPAEAVEGTLPAGLSQLIAADLRDVLRSEASDSRTYQLHDGTYEVFLDVYVPRPRVVIVGAVQSAQALARLSKALGYRVIVTDARAAFATPERFPDADEVIKGWPQDVLPGIRFDDSTYVVLLSHDPKFDQPTLHHVLPLPARYIGAIGSRRTQEQRRERLLAEGFDRETVDRIHGPIGLDLGAKSAEEIALSILAEITAVRHGRNGGMMTTRSQSRPGA
jgi:xanthine dehydrogenase accessory factor